METTHSLDPERVPIVIFLYVDYSRMPKAEADHFVDELLKSSITVYGLRDERSPQVRTIGWLGGEIGGVRKYIAAHTGGSYPSVGLSQYEEGLKQIFEEIQSRYELGFTSKLLHGKRHKLRVALSRPAAKEHKGLKLRCRTGYLAVDSRITNPGNF